MPGIAEMASDTMEQIDCVQPCLDVRVAVFNKTLDGSFRRLYPDFQPDNENYPTGISAAEPHDFECSCRRAPGSCAASRSP